MFLGIVNEALPVICTGEETRTSISSSSSGWLRACTDEFDLIGVTRSRWLGILVFESGKNNSSNCAENTVMPPFKSFVLD